ncbi:uncharacterized protein TRIADDRAFT_58316 [Trichoplax adhaerens]|uniref:Uncharacterized protein n=1 Tax=Trichoplax adhaerens TaxID=10228 RepID=B3S1J8_TRIAD|nr:predicted protein [Trichoplax adhaerens]EDV23239.1 predicted protein [Trichoplax adhaerens]|eukprot:XP_002114149.1 predicted protein [Trichoplax adhaerens]
MGSGSSTCASDKSVEIKLKMKGSSSIPIRRPSAILNAEINTKHLTINPTTAYRLAVAAQGGTVSTTNTGNNLPKKNKNRIVRNQKYQKPHFEIFKASNGEEYTIFVRTDSHRFYINCITQEWKPIDSSWYDHGTFFACEQHEAEEYIV